MQTAPVPVNESERLASLYQLKILDTAPEERFERITKLALFLFKVPISTITLVDSNREWFKSCQGLTAKEGERAISFCGHAMLSDGVFVIPDATKDKRFADNPMVVGPPYIRFYAGVPLFAADVQRVGTFCIKDYKPRSLDAEEEKHLKALAIWSELELNVQELGRALEARRVAEGKILELNEILRLLNKILRHDILNDLTVINGETKMFVEKGDKGAVEDVVAASQRSMETITKMRELESAVAAGKPLVPYRAREVIKKATEGFGGLIINIQGDGEILADEAFGSVIQNLVRNAQVHGQTDKVDIIIEQKDKNVEIRVRDYGKGIPKEIQRKLFQEGHKYGETGHTGLGLYIVYKTIRRYGGEVWVGDNQPRGTIFGLILPSVESYSLQN